MQKTERRDLVTCTECDGEGAVTTLGGPVDDTDGEPTLAELQEIEVECDRCGGRGTEYDGTGCPRCGAPSKDLSSTLMPSSAYKVNCPNCPWWELVG